MSNYSKPQIKVVSFKEEDTQISTPIIDLNTK